jgi:alanyl-tRNA synthetase
MYEPTVKLYDADPYAVEFSAAVKQIAEKKDQIYELILDQTLFFPEEGGQTADRGTIGGWPVLDVQTEREVIRHEVRIEDPDRVPEPGDSVEGKIAWEERFSNMQNHTGEHIISGLIHQQYGYDNIGFHLSQNTVTLDISGFLDQAQLDAIEQKANQIIWRNVPVYGTYPPAGELEDMEYRSKKEIDGPVRIVTIEGVDRCACCAPHVSRTGEIGMIRILSAMKMSDGMRLTILCGQRAFADLKRKARVLEEISHLTSRKQEEAADGVRQLLEEKASQQQRIYRLQTEQMEDCLRQVPEGQKDVFLFLRDLDSQIQREGVNRLMERHEGYCGVFAETGADSWRYIIGSRKEDARVCSRILKEQLNGKGGGKPVMVQGAVTADPDRIREVLRGLEDSRCE